MVRRTKSGNGGLAALAAVCAALAAAFLGLLIFSRTSGQQAQRQIYLGQKYLEEMRYDDAVLAFLDATEIAPKNARAYVGLGTAYQAQAAEAATADWERQQLGRSGKAFETARDLMPERKGTYLSLADVRMSQGRSWAAEDPRRAEAYFREAEAVLKDLLGLDPGNKEALEKQREAQREAEEAKSAVEAGTGDGVESPEGTGPEAEGAESDLSDYPYVQRMQVIHSYSSGTSSYDISYDWGSGGTLTVDMGESWDTGCVLYALAPFGITDNEPMLACMETWESPQYLIFPENPLITSGQLTHIELRKSGGASTVYDFRAEGGRLLSMTETETAREGATLSSSGNMRTAVCEVTYTYGSRGELLKVFRDLPYELQENGNFGEYDLSYDADGTLVTVYRGRHGGDISSSATIYLTRDGQGRIAGTDMPLLTGTAQEMHDRTELRYDAGGRFLQAVRSSGDYSSDLTCEYDGEGRLSRVSDSRSSDFILFY